jgi:hypothetical protein
MHLKKRTSSMLDKKSEISSSLFALLFLCAICVIPFGGCARSAATASDMQLRAAMKLLGLQYGNYLAEKGTPPPDEPALRSYLNSRLTILSDFGVKSVDDLLRSGRDGQPLKVIYASKVPLPEHPEYVWVAYEEAGVGGKRLACDSRGGIYEITDLEYSKQFAGK